jgi:hypothetical protein
VSFAATILCVASQLEIPKVSAYFVIDSVRKLLDTHSYFDLKMEEEGSWIKLHNELRSLYSSPNIVRVIKLRRMRWAGHEARMGEGRGVYKVLVERPEGKRPLGRPWRRWRITLRWTIGRQGWMGRTGFNWLWIGSGGGLL